MRNRRGQVTIFIIVAIVIVAGIVFYFTFNNSSSKARGPETDNIYSFVEDCIEGTGEDAIYHISQNGGYFLPAEISTPDGIPYYYYKGRNLMLSKAEVETELALYIDNMLEYCTAGFVDFSESSVTSREVLSDVVIMDGEIILNVKYPLTVSKNGKTYLLESFENIIIPTRLNLVYESVREIIKDQLNFENVCLSCITNVALKNDLIIDIIGLENATLFVVQDENSKINGVPLKWQFANKY